MTETDAPEEAADEDEDYEMSEGTVASGQPPNGSQVV